MIAEIEIITDLLYEFNVRGDIKIEELAELIVSELNNLDCHNKNT